jgi:hypothetical protein
MFSFKKKLEMKDMLFSLNKHLLNSLFELREITLDDSRRPKQSEHIVFEESVALVYFLVCSPLKLTKILPSSVEMFLFFALKGVCCAFVGREKDESQQLIESRFDDYYDDLEVGFNEAEICSKYLNFLGIVHSENDTIQNFSYTSFISSLFMFSMSTMADTKKNFKVKNTPLSQDDWESLGAQVQQLSSKYEEK